VEGDGGGEGALWQKGKTGNRIVKRKSQKMKRLNGPIN
jgi:hypothetical protein